MNSPVLFYKRTKKFSFRLEENPMRVALSPHRLIAGAAILLGLVAAPMAQAASPPALAGLCASCHGQNGISPYPAYPNLAGQKEGYIAYALQQYQTHQRLGAQAGIMSAVAGQLSTDDIKALAAYYASLSGQ
jgi:cytochrome c553